MRWIEKIAALLKIDTYGWLAVSNLIVCTVSGIILAIPYDVHNPYESISLILLDNPAASLVRNLHFWSAQAFLIFTIIHIFDHFPKNTEYNLSVAVWLRLVISVIAVFFVMLTGFILKGDPDAIQAHRIFSALLKGLPLAGNLIEYSLLGDGESLQIIYVHHIATATIFIFIVLYEHVKSLWPQVYRFFLVTFLLLIISFFFRAPLHDGFNPIVKGPWYFVGLQEILHWMDRPSLVWYLILLFLVLFFLVRIFQRKANAILKRLLLVSAILYLGLTLIGYFFRGENWEWTSPFSDRDLRETFPTISAVGLITLEAIDADVKILKPVAARKEGCLACHLKMEGFSPSHSPEAIGCVGCHAGDPFTLDATAAHKDMIIIPGNLENADRSCGTANCHPIITERVHRSIMTTNSGMVSVNRFVFGESDELSVLSHIKEIGYSPADQHLRDMCAHCHLGNQKEEFGPIGEMSRGGGCIACHLSYSKTARSDLHKYMASGKDHEPLYHSSLSVNISDDNCFGCHSRSGRIALSYQGWHETHLEPEEVLSTEGYRVLEDQRVMRYVLEDVHHKGEMECIDCHISFGLMGDGNLYHHKEEQVKVACEDCHFAGDPDIIDFESLDYESAKIARLREYSQDTWFLRSKKSGLALVNTVLMDDTPFLRRKSRDTLLPLKSPARVCIATNAHSGMDCKSCHTAWVPQCIGCHNIFDPETPGYDLLEHREKEGSWVEFVGQYFAEPPVLGILKEEKGTRTISTFTPGMILTIDKSGFPGFSDEDMEEFHRLYAPISSHTTTSGSRSCVSCHLEPLAIGFGRGELVYSAEGMKGIFSFSPRFANHRIDGLPEDAWTGYLRETRENRATRPGMRPFNVEEQKRILTVGACLTCHPEGSDIMIHSLDNFSAVLEQVSPFCVIPVWTD
jgi:quinol-cytochrome oxidoreductase complex cytochrome b subunit